LRRLDAKSLPLEADSDTFVSTTASSSTKRIVLLTFMALRAQLRPQAPLLNLSKNSTVHAKKLTKLHLLCLKEQFALFISPKRIFPRNTPIFDWPEKCFKKTGSPRIFASICGQMPSQALIYWSFLRPIAANDARQSFSIHSSGRKWLALPRD